MTILKSIFAVAALLVAPFVMVGCSDDDTTTPDNPQGGEEPTAITFDIQLAELTSTSVMMTVTPSDESAFYYFDAVEKENLEMGYGNSFEEYLDAMIVFLNTQGMSNEEAVLEIASVGVDSYHFNSLSPNTEYVAFAFAMSADGKLISEAATKEFTTQEVSQETISWDVTFDEILYDGASFTITPSDDTTPYYFTVRPSYAYSECMSNEEILDAIMLEDGMMLDYYAVTGEYESLYDMQEFILCSDTGYDLIIFAYSNGEALSEVKLVPFRSKASEMTIADCSFDIAVNQTEDDVVVEVSPTDENRMYMWDVEKKSVVDELGGTKAYIEAYIQDVVDTDGRYELDFVRVMGGDISYIGQNNFDEGEACVAWAAYVDERGEIVGEVVSYDFEALGIPNMNTEAPAKLRGVKPVAARVDARNRNFNM